MLNNLAMSPGEWVYSHLRLSDIAFALLGCFLFSCLREKLTNKGPMSWPVLGITPLVFLHMKDMYDWITKSLIKAGGTFHYRGVWLGGSYGITTTDPANIEYMLKTNFKNFPKGEYYRERFHDLLEDGIFNADDELWKEQRWIAKTEMHSRRFLEYSLQTARDLVQHKLLKLMENFSSSGEAFDLQDVLMRFTFDNICIVALGADPGALAIDLPEVPFAKAFEKATEYSSFRFMIPPFVWKPMKFFGLGYEKKLEKAIKTVHEFADKMVIARVIKLQKQGNLNDQSDLLSSLIHMKSKGKGDEKASPLIKFFRSFCTSFILAGRDTTSVALAWFFWLVHKHPEVENRIVREIKEILSRRKDLETHETETFFTVEELNDMAYLHAALSESLRLYPSVSMDMKQALEDDVFPDGTVVKKGARVHYSIYSMGRMETIWGKDFEEFKPDRWIKDGRFVSKDQFKFVAFNAGPRLCLGKNFAYLQMKIVAASILLRYSVKVVEGHVVAPKVTTTLYMKHGLMVTLKPRLADTWYDISTKSEKKSVKQVEMTHKQN